MILETFRRKFFNFSLFSLIPLGVADAITTIHGITNFNCIESNHIQKYIIDNIGLDMAMKLKIFLSVISVVIVYNVYHNNKDSIWHWILLAVIVISQSIYIAVVIGNLIAIHLNII